MKTIKIFFMLLLCCIFCSKKTKAQTWEWAKGINNTNGNSKTNAWRVLSDSSGYIYSFASFIFGGQPPATFSTCTLNALGSKLLKYDANGNCIWVKDNAGIQMIGIGKKEDKIFTIGSTWGGTYNRCTIDSGTFMAKYDLDGNCTYSKTICLPFVSFAYSEAMDMNDNFYLSGPINDTLLIDTVTLIPGGSNSEKFISKFDNMSNVIWVKKFQIDGNIQLTRLDIGEFFYGYGGFSDTLIFDSFSLVSRGNTDGFIAKFDTNGTVLWVKQFGSTGWDGGLSYVINKSIYSLAPFDAGFISDCDSGTGKGVVLTKYDTSGSCIWSKVYPEWWPRAITSDSMGNIILAGTGGGTDIFGCGVINTSPFVVLLDSNGNCMNMAMADGGISSWDIGIDKNNNIYLAGMTVIPPVSVFGNDTIYAVGSPGYSTGFIVRLSGLITDTPPAKMQRKGLFIFPNPAQQKYTLVIPEDLPLEGMFIRVFDSTGRLAMEEPAYSHQQTLDMWGYPKGLYLVRVNVGMVDYVGRIVVE